MAKKTLLIILDGFGIGDHLEDDAIFNTPTPNLDTLLEKYPHSRLLTCGEDVGLPAGQMGNSEVGHLNIGGGRVVYQDLMKINRAIEDGTLASNAALMDAMSYARDNNKALHLMGLASTGGVHSSLEHLFALCDMAKQYGLKKVYIHCFMDGRDTDPESGAGFIARIQEHCSHSAGEIADIIGRYYAMDRDKRWERVKVAYDMLVNGEGKRCSDMVKAMKESYSEGVTDEFIKPIINDAVDGTIGEGDAVIFFNYRNDRAKELTIVLTQREEDGMKPIPGLRYYCMTPYDASFTGVKIIFDKENVPDTLAEYLSGKGKKQLHIAETEKYAHVTFFFNGGREEPFEGEERILVKSPSVATYDLQPEMSAPEVTDRLVEQIDKEKFDFIVVNFANGDMVGHTGNYKAIQKAIAALDVCVKKVTDAALAHGYATIIIADHGNADQAKNPDGTPNTAHSLNPVPFIYVADDAEGKTAKDGRLADVAPTILKIMGLQAPESMTGTALI